MAASIRVEGSAVMPLLACSGGPIAVSPDCDLCVLCPEHVAHFSFAADPVVLRNASHNPQQRPPPAAAAAAADVRDYAVQTGTAPATWVDARWSPLVPASGRSRLCLLSAYGDCVVVENPRSSATAVVNLTPFLSADPRTGGAKVTAVAWARHDVLIVRKGAAVLAVLLAAGLKRARVLPPLVADPSVGLHRVDVTGEGADMRARVLAADAAEEKALGVPRYGEDVYGLLRFRVESAGVRAPSDVSACVTETVAAAEEEVPMATHGATAAVVCHYSIKRQPLARLEAIVAREVASVRTALDAEWTWGTVERLRLALACSLTADVLKRELHAANQEEDVEAKTSKRKKKKSGDGPDHGEEDFDPTWEDTPPLREPTAAQAEHVPTEPKVRRMDPVGAAPRSMAGVSRQSRYLRYLVHIAVLVRTARTKADAITLRALLDECMAMDVPSAVSIRPDRRQAEAAAERAQQQGDDGSGAERGACPECGGTVESGRDCATSGCAGVRSTPSGRLFSLNKRLDSVTCPLCTASYCLALDGERLAVVDHCILCGVRMRSRLADAWDL